MSNYIFHQTFLGLSYHSGRMLVLVGGGSPWAPFNMERLARLG